MQATKIVIQKSVVKAAWNFRLDLAFKDRNDVQIHIDIQSWSHREFQAPEIFFEVKSLEWVTYHLK